MSNSERPKFETKEGTNTMSQFANTFGTFKKNYFSIHYFPVQKSQLDIKPNNNFFFKTKFVREREKRFILVIAFSFIRTYCHPNRLRIVVVQKMGPKGSSIFTRRLYLSKYSFSSNSLQVNWNWPRFIYIKNKNSNRWFSAL